MLVRFKIEFSLARLFKVQVIKAGTVSEVTVHSSMWQSNGYLMGFSSCHNALFSPAGIWRGMGFWFLVMQQKWRQRGIKSYYCYQGAHASPPPLWSSCTQISVETVEGPFMPSCLTWISQCWERCRAVKYFSFQTPPIKDPRPQCRANRQGSCSVGCIYEGLGGKIDHTHYSAHVTRRIFSLVHSEQ